MKRFLSISLTCLIIFLFQNSYSLYAQRGNSDSENIFKELSFVKLVEGNGRRDTTVIKILYENAPKYFNAPDMPRFALIGNERKFYLGIGGYLKTTLLYDIGNPVSNASYFVTSSIPNNLPKGNNAAINFTAGTSNIFINFIALPHTKNKVGTYINFNFSGQNYGLSLQNAYITYRGFTLGYGVSLFTDGAAVPPMIDMQGPNAMSFVRNTLIDYRYKFNDHWSVGIGLEMPVVNATYTDGVYSVTQKIPDIPIVVKYSYNNGNGWIRFASVLRNLYYGSNNKDKSSSKFGWAVQLSGCLPIISKLDIFYQGVYGKGASQYIQDMQGCGVGLVPVANGKMDVSEEWGAYMGVQYNPCSKILMSATYSYVNSYLPDKVLGFTYQIPATSYKKAQYFVTNCFYQLNPVISCGVEYLYGRVTDISGKYNHDNRIQTALRVNF